MASKQSFIGRGISNILKLIGCFVVFLFVLGYIINYAENFIPYNIIPRDRLTILTSLTQTMSMMK